MLSIQIAITRVSGQLEVFAIPLFFRQVLLTILNYSEHFSNIWVTIMICFFVKFGFLIIFNWYKDKATQIDNKSFFNYNEQQLISESIHLFQITKL